MLPRWQPVDRWDDDPFGSGEPPRRLRIVVDSDSFTDSTEALDDLIGFAAHKAIDLYSTGHAATGSIRLDTGRIHPDGDGIGVAFQSAHEEQEIGSAIGGAKSWMEQARSIADERDLKLDDVRRAVMLARTSERVVKSDAFVTSNPIFLSPSKWDYDWRHANLMSPDDALALVGIFLRSHGDFTVFSRERRTRYLTGEQFYLVSARLLLPSFAKWQAGCVGAGTLDGGTPLPNLARTVEVRMARLLMARDRLQRQYLLPRSRERAAEALFYLDVALLMADGAFEAVAQVADRVILGGDGSQTSWRNNRGRRVGNDVVPPWRERLVSAEKSLATVLAENHVVLATIRLLGVLRNTIHETALSHVVFGPAEEIHHPHNVVVLEGKLGQRVLQLASAIGEPQDLGVDPSFASVYLWPDIFIDKMIPLLSSALDAIIGRTPTSSLGHAFYFDPASYENGLGLIDATDAPRMRRLLGLSGAESFALDSE